MNFRKTDKKSKTFSFNQLISPSEEENQISKKQKKKQSNISKIKNDLKKFFKVEFYLFYYKI